MTFRVETTAEAERDADAILERLVKLGASRYPLRFKPGDDFVVLEDPDGNLFCVVQVAETSAASMSVPSCSSDYA